MNITRDIVTDLLPAFLSGEASADTVELVERFFTEDPEFATLVRDDPESFFESEIPVTLTSETEMKALERTKKLLGIRSSLLGAAIFLTLLPLSVYGDESGVYWVFRDQVASLMLILSVAVAVWVGYFATRYRLRSSGL